MKRGLVCLLAVGTLALFGSALAAPQPLTSADLAQVVAGEASASTDNAVAVDGDGSANSAVGALADLGAVALNGDSNTVTAEPDSSALAYGSSHAISAGDNSYGLALADANSTANFTDDPSETAINQGDCNTATNFYDNSDVANAIDNGMAVSDGDDGANALGENSQAFEANSEVAVASSGQAVGDANDAALNVGNNNLAIEDPGDVTAAAGKGVALYEPSSAAVAQDCGSAIHNDGEIAQTTSGIAFANPDDTALAFGDKSIATLDSGDVAIASDCGLAVQSELDAVIALDHTQAFEDNGEVANATGSAPAIAAEGDVAYAITPSTVAIADSSDANVAIHGNAAQNTSDGQAVAGEGNNSIFQSVDKGIAAIDNAKVIATSNEVEDTTIDYGSAAVIGNCNDVCAVADDATITLDTEGIPYTASTQQNDSKGGGDATGVVAKSADVCSSFNDDETETEVDATIECSFNVNSSAMCIDGQNAASGIALVNSLGDPESGINLNVTSASASIPTLSAASAPGATAGISSADTTLTQVTFNDSCTLTVTF